ncbi:MAG: TetR/AcrR family transcriptional regulator [Porticoccaceae bacterium]
MNSPASALLSNTAKKDSVSNANESLRDRKKRLTHQRICSAAGELFAAQGVQNTTVDSIAAAAEISKPTFFNYFANKQAVLHALIEIMDAQFIRYIEAEIDQSNSTQVRIENLMRRSATHIAKNSALTQIMLVEGMSGLADQSTSTDRMARLNNAMAQLVEAGREQGDVNSQTAVTVQVQVLVGSYLYALLNWLSVENLDLFTTLEETATLLANALKPNTPAT